LDPREAERVTASNFRASEKEKNPIQPKVFLNLSEC